LLVSILLVVIYAAVCSDEYHLTGRLALAAAVLQVVATFLLTRREHPQAPSPDRTRVFVQRVFAVTSAICIGVGIYHQSLFLPITSWRLLGWSGAGFWHLPAVLLLLSGWLLHCACVVMEYRFLAKLAARLRDRFMVEQCKIAGLGAGASGVLILFLMPGLFNLMAMFDNVLTFAVLVVAALFLVWTSFLNVYCAARFTQQFWLANERSRRRKTEVALA
jgi:hypothetical protein